MEESAQEQLDRIKSGNRARAKKFQEKVKASDKKMISAILIPKAYNELTRRRDASIQAGTPLSFGDVILNALFPDVSTNAINNDSENIITNKPDIKPEPIEAPQGSDEKPESHGKGLTQEKWTQEELDGILLKVGEMYPKGKGNRQRRADKLNANGIKLKNKKGKWIKVKWDATKTGNNINNAKNRLKKKA